MEAGSSIKVSEISRDLHGSDFESKRFTTEYEEKFISEGKPIYYIRMIIGGDHMIMAHENGRKIPKEDKIFALNGRAKAMIADKGKEAVSNATIGALLDDDGNLMVLSSVLEAIKDLSPTDYAEYAPIGGIPAFKEAVKKAAFRGFKPDA